MPIVRVKRVCGFFHVLARRAGKLRRYELIEARVLNVAQYGVPLVPVAGYNNCRKVFVRVCFKADVRIERRFNIIHRVHHLRVRRAKYVLNHIMLILLLIV